jgi:replication factor C subunit 1
MKSGGVTASVRLTKEVPDLEEAIEEEDDEAAFSEPRLEDEEEELDLSKDKYVKQPKVKKPSAGKKAVARSRKMPRDTKDADESEEETRPKKARTGRAKGIPTKAKVRT